MPAEESADAPGPGAGGFGKLGGAQADRIPTAGDQEARRAADEIAPGGSGVQRDQYAARQSG